VPGADAGWESFELQPATGRMLTTADEGNVVVLGSNLALEHGVVAGGTVEIRGRRSRHSHEVDGSGLLA
jgi:hypothetical protein